MDINVESNGFITIKDHKENLLNHPELCLINPAKNELRGISKTKLDNINKKLFEATKISQWKNTVSPIKWFNSQKDKHLMKLVVFGIKDFYPYITQDLWEKALNFANEDINTIKCDIDVIHQARKSLLFDGSHT